METVKCDVASSQSADFWRERSECLEEWVCELLIKNQALRMDLQKEHSQERYLVETSLALSLISLPLSPFASVQRAFRTESTESAVDVGAASCPHTECAEIRKSVIECVVMNGADQEASD